MALFHDIQNQIGLLEQPIIFPVPNQSVFDITDPVILEIDPGETFFTILSDDLGFPGIKGFYKIIPPEQHAEKDYPDNYDNDLEK
jgi:hypothetical protein